MDTPATYWVRQHGSEEWSVAELRAEGWLMFGAVTAPQKDLCFAEVGEPITIPVLDLVNGETERGRNRFEHVFIYSWALSKEA
jgi:hypothetical protein